MKSWMKELAYHYGKTRDSYPEDELMIVFDIDNTIIDMRQMIAYVLRAYDQAHGTRHFKRLAAESLTINENQVDEYLGGLDIEPGERESVLAWYLDKRWDPEAILESHRPYEGVMEVLRWFQMQPKTHVGLNTGRPELLRADTLRSLNELGAAYKVQFEDELLYMNPGTWDDPVTGSKIDGIRAFQDTGYRVFAMIDNEPDNLEAVASIDDDGSILLLHADTIFDSSRSRLPKASVSGKNYDLTELISEAALPEHVRFVWHGVNDENNLRQFIASNVQWGECDVRLDRQHDVVILRHDSFSRRLRGEGEQLLLLEDVLPRLIGAGKSVKLDIKEKGRLVEKVVHLIEALDIDHRDLWFNGNVEELGPEVFTTMAGRFPQATIQCSIDHLTTMVMVAPTVARTRLEALHDLGVNRVSLAWGGTDLGVILNHLDEWGYEVNIYNVPDLESFLKAVLLHPTSVTSDFNFPQWHLYGRGPGANSHHHTYTLAGQP